MHVICEELLTSFPRLSPRGETINHGQAAGTGRQLKGVRAVGVVPAVPASRHLLQLITRQMRALIIY